MSLLEACDVKSTNQMFEHFALGAATTMAVVGAYYVRKDFIEFGGRWSKKLNKLIQGFTSLEKLHKLDDLEHLRIFKKMEGVANRVSVFAKYAVVVTGLVTSYFIAQKIYQDVFGTYNQTYENDPKQIQATKVNRLFNTLKKSKKNARKIVKPEDLQEQTKTVSQSVTEQRLTKIIKFSSMLLFIDDEFKMVVHGLGKHALLHNAHFYSYFIKLHESAKLKFVNPITREVWFECTAGEFLDDKNVREVLTMSDCGNELNTDLSLTVLKMDKVISVPMKKNILNCFATEEFIEKLPERFVATLCLFRENKGTCLFHLIDVEVKYDRTTCETNGILFSTVGFSYQEPTIGGDCGGMLMYKDFVLGIHSAGQAGVMGYAQAVDREFLVSRLNDANYDLPFAAAHQIVSTGTKLDNLDVVMEGPLPASSGVLGSSLEKSPIYGCLGESGKDIPDITKEKSFDSIVTYFENRNYHSFDPDLMGPIVDEVVAEFSHEAKIRNLEFKELTFEQALFGDTDLGMKGIPMGTSPGPDWCYLGMTDKKKLFDSEKKTYQPILKEVVDAYEEGLETGIRIPSVAKHFIKDEPMKPEKVLRSVLGSGVHVTIADKKMFGILLAIITLAHFNLGYMVGSDPDIEFDVIHSQCVLKWFLELDHTGWDKHLIMELWYWFLKICDALYGRSQKIHNAISDMAQCHLRINVGKFDVLARSKMGMDSGRAMTLGLNCVFNKMCMKYFKAKLYREFLFSSKMMIEAGVTDVKSLSIIAVKRAFPESDKFQGDDVLLEVSDDMPITFEQLRDEAARFDLILTPAEKGAITTKPKRLKDCTLMSRSWFECDYLNVVKAPLKPNSIIDMVNFWFKNRSEADIKQLFDGLMRELAKRDRKYYEESTSKVSEAARKAKIHYVFKPYEEVLRMIYPEKLYAQRARSIFKAVSVAAYKVGMAKNQMNDVNLGEDLVTVAFEEEAAVESHYYEDVKEFLMRPLPIYQTRWSMTDNVGSSIQFGGSFPVNQLVMLPIVKQKMAGYLHYRASFKIDIVLSCSSYTQGEIMAVWVPANSTGRNFASLVEKSQLPHVIISAKNKNVSLVVPFTAPQDYSVLGGGIDAHYGSIKLVVLSQLILTDPKLTYVNILVYSSMHDLILSTPTSFQMRKNDIFTAAKAKTKPLFKTVMGAVPALDRVLSTAAWVTKKAAATAEYMGYGHQINEASAGVTNDLPGRFARNFDGPMSLVGMGMSYTEQVSGDVDMSRNGEDEMSFEYLKKVMTLFEVVKVDQTMGPGTIIYSQWVSPVMNIKQVSGYQIRKYGGPMFYLSDNFRFWRGSIKFKFRFVTIPNNDARVSVAYYPEYTGFNAPPDGSDVTVIRKTVDIGEFSEIEFECKYMGATPFKIVDEDLTSSTTTFSAHANPSRTAGLLVVKIIHPLTVIANAPLTFDMQVWACAGDDFELGGEDFSEGFTLTQSMDGKNLGTKFTSLGQILGRYACFRPCLTENPVRMEVSDDEDYGRKNLGLPSLGGNWNYFYPYTFSSLSSVATGVDPVTDPTYVRAGVTQFGYLPFSCDNLSKYAPMYTYFKGGINLKVGSWNRAVDALWMTVNLSKLNRMLAPGVLPSSCGLIKYGAGLNGTSYITRLTGMACPVPEAEGIKIPYTGVTSFKYVRYMNLNAGAKENYHIENDLLFAVSMKDFLSNNNADVNPGVFMRAASDDFRFGFFLAAPPIIVGVTP